MARTVGRKADKGAIEEEEDDFDAMGVVPQISSSRAKAPGTTNVQNRKTSGNIPRPSTRGAGKSQNNTSSTVVETQIESDSDVEEINIAPAQPKASTSSAATSRNGASNSRKQISTRDDTSSSVPSKHGRAEDVNGASSPKRKRVRTAGEWQELVDQLIKERDAFKAQFQQLYQLRQTNAEEQFARFKILAEEHAKNQEQQISTLLKQVTRLDELSGDRRALPLTLLTREATDARFQKYETDLHQRDAEINNLKSELQEKDAENVILRKELDEEIRLSKEEHQRYIALRNNVPVETPPGPAAGRMSDTDGPTTHNLHRTTRNGTIITLYEDMTKFLVTDFVRKQGKYGDEHELLCELAVGDRKVVFRLETVWKIGMDDAGKDQPQPWVWYVPLEFVPDTEETRGEFLGNSFQFPRDQCFLFYHNALYHLGHIPPGAAIQEEEEEEHDVDEAQPA